MNLKEIFSLIYSDYRRYRATGRGQGNPLAIIFLTQGFWASTVYRLSHAVTQIKPFLIRRPLRILFFILEKIIEILTGIRIPGECKIGKGLYIGHFGLLIVNDQAVLGENCNLSQGVTIGVSRRGDKAGVSVIGDRVYIGANAVLFGDIHIGSDSAIGAGAVVNESCEDRSVIAGNPARLLSRKGSFEYIRFDDMENHPERAASIAMRDKAE